MKTKPAVEGLFPQIPVRLPANQHGKTEPETENRLYGVAHKSISFQVRFRQSGNQVNHHFYDYVRYRTDRTSTWTYSAGYLTSNQATAFVV